MPLFNEKQKSVQGEPGREKYEQLLKKIQERAQQKKSASAPKVEKKDTSILGGKSAIPMQEAAWKFRKAPSIIPDSGGAMFSEQEKKKMFEEASKKYGSYLETKERPQIIKDLEKQKSAAKTGAEKQAIDRKIRVFKRELFGK